ncbi:ArsR/SmtB family transcription factor [Haliovirga abyssi]|uniref:Transcriptional regulator n=1 Tax=Haliovirga abyssi TaxID=2996794 RepID=A0AAU9DEE8_9FUSO|nr:metalloregulator ArsR/SmtB family transcription factor [Haliovirga abyssi]BDU50573.1 transcriptional regulator [Haliovirga abyssi]
MSNNIDTDRAVLVLKMMANETRLKILYLLKKNEDGICVGNMEEILNIPQSSVSQHLAHLRNSGIISCKKDGKKVCYKISDKTAEKILLQLELADIEEG